MNDAPAPAAAVSFADLVAALDPREQRFVLEYLECLNAALAARRVYGGIRTAKQKGYVMVRRPDVAAAIDAGLAEQNARLRNDPDRIVSGLLEIAFADPVDLVDRSGNPLPVRRLAPEIRRAIASVDFETAKVTTEDVIDGVKGQPAATAGRVTTRTRVVRYRLVPKTPAIELLGRRLKMFGHQLELDATDNLASLIAAAFGRPAPAHPAPDE